MAVARRQTAPVASSAAASTTITCMLPGAPVAGNMLVLCMSGDKNTGALTLAGFTQLFEDLSTSVSLYYYYKVSDGTETSISPTWTTSSSAGNTAVYMELEDTAVAGSTWQISGSAHSPTNEVTTNSQSTGITPSVTVAGLSIAMASIDSSQSITAPIASNLSWSNSYTVVASDTTASGHAGTYTSEVAVSSGTTVSTFTYTGTADQVSGAVAVFSKVSGVLGTDVPLATMSKQMTKVR